MIGNRWASFSADGEATTLLTKQLSFIVSMPTGTVNGAHGLNGQATRKRAERGVNNAGISESISKTEHGRRAQTSVISLIQSRAAWSLCFVCRYSCPPATPLIQRHTAPRRARRPALTRARTGRKIDEAMAQSAKRYDGYPYSAAESWKEKESLPIS
jgi:hypothetical protein